MKKIRFFQLVALLSIGILGFDSYQDIAGHHETDGHASLCQTSCGSHMTVTAVAALPIVEENQAYFLAEPVVKSLQVSLSIFNPPKTLA